MNPNQKQPILVVETDASGNTVPFSSSNLTFVVTDPAVATLSSDNQFVIGVAPGTTTLTVTDTVNKLTGSVSVVVTAAPDVPTTLTVTLGAAVAV